MHSLLAFLSLFSLVLAGCVAPDAVDDAASAAVWGPLIEDAQGNVLPGPFVWRSGEVSEGTVVETPLKVHVPEGNWESNDGRLVVLLRWPFFNQSSLYGGGEEPDFDMVVLDEAGKKLADGEERDVVLGIMGHGMPVPHSSAVAAVEEFAGGAITIKVTSTLGSTFFEISAFVETTVQGPVRELLPDLVAVPPQHLKVALPHREAPLLEAAGIYGCGTDEIALHQVTKCLRFDLGVANVGEGPLEMRLPASEAANGMAGEGKAIQRIFLSDGSFRDVPSAAATFHATHGHYHFAGEDFVDLYEYDWETDTRGALVGEYEKKGLCYADLTLADMTLHGTTIARYLGQGCLDPTAEGDFFTGLSVNWIDVYPVEYPDQFIDVSDVPDGVYEMAIMPNSAGYIIETDNEANEASIIFRMTGNDIEVLRRVSPLPAMP